jgi:hypothetical protein
MCRNQAKGIGALDCAEQPGRFPLAQAKLTDDADCSGGPLVQRGTEPSRVVTGTVADPIGGVGVTKQGQRPALGDGIVTSAQTLVGPELRQPRSSEVDEAQRTPYVQFYQSTAA